MSGLSRSFNLLRGTMKHQITPKATITAKPAKHVLTIAEKTIAMVTMFVTILAPSGYVLANLENYKKRPGAAE